MTDATTMTQREYCKLRRDTLRVEGICIDCGRVPVASGHVRCEKCLEARRKHKHKRKKDFLSIADVNRMAAERGISYGMMVLELERVRRHE